MSKKKIVVIGGGNGSAICLEGLKKYADKFSISAVISTSDSGGSSGKLRQEFHTPPPGDILRAILSLSKYDYQTLRRIFYQPRFQNLGKLNSHNLGNLFLTLASQYSGSFLRALEALSQSVEAQGKVYPVMLSSTDLVAELDNGKIVRTEAFIDKPKYNRGWKIKKVWLEPNCEAYAEARQAIETADYIILSPGSLYTSIIATLLPTGIKQAIDKRRVSKDGTRHDSVESNKKAKIIYVAGNAYRLDGETGPEKLSDTILHLERYLPCQLDMVIYNNHKLTKAQQAKYKEKNWGVIEFDANNLKPFNIKSFDFEKNGIGLDPNKLGKFFASILPKL